MNTAITVAMSAIPIELRNASVKIDCLKMLL